MIKVKDLSKNYGSVEAVKSISFDLNDGEVIGFLGANGAGKTTTLKMMTGYLVPTKGSITVNDMDIIEDMHSIQKQIGYLPELNPLYSEMRVYDYLEFLASIRDITGPQFKEALARVVEQCGLRGVVHKNISDCSKGYKQRIGLAAAMIHDPKILILDEPVTGLDPNQIIEIRSLIRSLGKEKLVFMSSHILQEIQAT
ncbi:MAG: ATP-binding cassette domain-containing protein, partial [Candidatus Neomarinimicrobiota bacterium]|nr:ATP-binding cassette domain-containing protein [Candidatus Neomarinimicrobiota bacterium]